MALNKIGKFIVLCNVYLLLFVTNTEAQNNTIDSLLNVLEKAEHDSIRMFALFDISWELMDIGDPNQAIEHANQALETGRRINHIRGISVTLSALGKFHLSNSEYKKALEYFQEVLMMDKASQNKKGIAVCLNDIGNVYSEQSEYSKAMEAYNQSLRIYSEIGDRSGLSMSYNNIGNLFIDQEDNLKALEYYHKSLDIDQELNDIPGVGIMYNNIAGIYQTLDDYLKARDYYLKSLKIRKDIQNFPGISATVYNLGEMYLDLFIEADSVKEKFLKAAELDFMPNDDALNVLLLDTALSCFLQSAEIDTKFQNQYDLTYSLWGIGKVWEKKGRPAIAIKYLSRAANIADKIGAKERVKSVSENLYTCYKSLNNSDSALFWFEKSVVLKDSIYSIENQKEFGRQEAKHEHEKELALMDEQRKRQKLITYSVGSGLGFVLLFAFVIVNRLRITRRQKSIIEDQKVIVEVKNKEILDSINYAKRLQDAILPSDNSVKQSLPESFILYQPKDIVAGDFYWFEQLEDLIFLAAADCTGHGVPGAMVSVVCSNALHRAVKEFNITDPGKILDKVRELVIETFEKSESEVKDGMDISLCTLNKTTGELNWAGANNPLWIISNGELKEIKADKQPIGVYYDIKCFTTHTIQLDKREVIYLFTDGFVDQFGGDNGKKFKSANFKKLLLSLENETMESQKRIISNVFERWKGDLEQIDDVCMIGVRIL